MLGGLTPREFLRRHWQKRPLLVRRALAPGTGISRDVLASLASREDVESRLVRWRARASRQRWTLQEGPIAHRRLAQMPARNWTLLVHGVNHHVADAEALQQRFAFIPRARFDDVMASVSAPGGGVGPHWDSFDVFLVQTQGRRVWNVCRPRAFEALEGAPLRIIRDFRAEDEYLLEPGDLLYLPPGWGHEGIALDASITCSVGFRAPAGAELGAAFVEYLADRSALHAVYRDPDLRPTARPARIGAAMLRKTHDTLERLRWTRRDTGEFLGQWLTTPKPHVSFARPARRLAARAFSRRLASARLRLDPKTLMLYHGRRLFINGEGVDASTPAADALRALADAREVQGRMLSAPRTRALIHEWYCAGFVHLS